MDIIKKYHDDGYDASDFFILAPSLKNNMQVNVLVNLIKEGTDMNIYINNDNIKLDKKLLINKILISAFHKSKGL